MANALDAYFRGMQGSMQAGQNALAMEQAVQKIQRDKQLRNILAGAYKQPQAGIPAMGAAPAQGPVPMGGTPLPDYPAQMAVPAQAGGFNVGGAQQQLLAKGFIPEAMQMEGFKPKKPAPFTLGKDQVRYGPSGEVIAKGPESQKEGAIKPSDVSGMRKEFTNQSKDFVKVRDAYRRIEASAQNPSPAGDLALIFNFMKVLDPGSTVREGEFAQVGAAGNLPTQVQRMYDQYATGQKLTPEQRADVVGRSNALYQAQEMGLAQLEDQYKGIAERYKINPQDIIVDYRVKQQQKKMNTQDKEALQWANQNPNDPRSIKILQRLGEK